MGDIINAIGGIFNNWGRGSTPGKNTGLEETLAGLLANAGNGGEGGYEGSEMADAMMEAARIAAAENERYQKLAHDYSEQAYSRAEGFYSPYKELGDRYLNQYTRMAEGGAPRFSLRDIGESPYASVYEWEKEQQDKAIMQSQAARGLIGAGAGLSEQIKADSGLAQSQTTRDITLQRQEWLDRLGLYNTDLGNLKDIANLGWQGAAGTANAALGQGSIQAGLAGQGGQTAASIYSNLSGNLGSMMSQYNSNQLGQAQLNSSNYWNQQGLNYANQANAYNRSLAATNNALGWGRNAWDAYRYMNGSGSGSGLGIYSPSYWGNTSYGYDSNYGLGTAVASGYNGTGSDWSGGWW